MIRANAIQAQESEKIVLVVLEPVSRVAGFIQDGEGGAWLKSVPYPVTEVTVDGELSSAWSYNLATGFLTLTDSPVGKRVRVRHSVRFASVAFTNPEGAPFFYDGRVISAPGFSFKVGVDQDLVAKIGSGQLVLENSDGGLDDMINRLHFEGQPATVYSYIRNTTSDEPLSSVPRGARPIYRGFVESKSADDNQVTLTIKDQTLAALGSISQSVFTENDNVPDPVIGRPKRLLYGRVAGLKVQTVDAVKGGYLIDGTVSGTDEGVTVTGTGTSFLTDLSPGDAVQIDGVKYGVVSVASDTAFDVQGKLKSTFSDAEIKVDPAFPDTRKNRQWHIAGHELSEPRPRVTFVQSSRRLQLSSVDGLNPGDVIYIEALDIFREILTVSQRRTDIRLRQEVVGFIPVNSHIVRLPVNSVTINGTEIPREFYTISNVSETKIEFTDNAEFSVADDLRFLSNVTFTNGSRTVTGSIDFTGLVNPRDWIKPDAEATWQEVLSVADGSMVLRTAYSGTTGAKATVYRKPGYLTDLSEVVVDCYGKSRGGDKRSTWLRSAPLVMQDTLDARGILTGDQSWVDATKKAGATVSLILPEQSEVVQAKTILDKMSQASSVAVSFDNDMELKGVNIAPRSNPDRVIRDSDIISHSVRIVSGESASKAVVGYRQGDVQTVPKLVVTVPYATDVLDIDSTVERNFDLYRMRDSESAAQSWLMGRTLARTDIDVVSDLRLEDVEVGTVVHLDLRRVFSGLGRAGNGKIMLVVGKKVSGNRVTLNLSDLGGTMPRACFIAPDSALKYTEGDNEVKLLNGYVTDEDGSADPDGISVGINLIV